MSKIQSSLEFLFCKMKWQNIDFFDSGSLLLMGRSVPTRTLFEGLAEKWSSSEESETIFYEYKKIRSYKSIHVYDILWEPFIRRKKSFSEMKTLVFLT